MDNSKGIDQHGNRIRIRFRYQGTPYIRYLDKPWPVKRNRTEAARLRDKYLARLKAGLPLDDDDRNPRNPTFTETAELYLKSLKREFSTVHSYEQCLNAYWMPYLYNIPMLHLTYSQVLDADLSNSWPSAKTRSNAIIPLRGVFNLAISTLEEFNVNFAAKLPKETREKKDVDPFDQNERQAILDALRELNQNAQDYFTLGFELGCRLPGELNALTWEDCTSKYAHIRKAMVRRQITTTKTHTDRKVLLTPEARAVLDRRIRPISGGYIFTNSAGGPHLDGDIMNGWWKKAIAKSNVRYRRAYNCRHTRATLDLMAGGKPAFLASQLGHTQAQFWKTYATWIASENDEAELQLILAGRATQKRYGKVDE